MTNYCHVFAFHNMKQITQIFRVVLCSIDLSNIDNKQLTTSIPAIINKRLMISFICGNNNKIQL